MSNALTLDFSREGATEIVTAMVEPTRPSQVAVIGPRGEGKTATVLGGMVCHAVRHREAGGTLPTIWLGVADTFKAHQDKTHDSLMDPMWGGCWRLEEGGHLAVFREPGGVDMVKLRLTGVEDAQALSRVRTQMHGLWFEEPAPAGALVQTSGLTDTAWGMGITSCRLPSYRNPKVMSLNLPDEDHWTAQLFVFGACPSCGVIPKAGERRLAGGTRVGGCDHRAYVRIRVGERASEAHRAEWRTALAGRPDLLRRLLDGEFGTIMQGPQVAVGFTRDTHVRPCRPEAGHAVWLGLDGGHTPTAVIGQRLGGYVRIVGALTSVDMGMEQFCQHVLEPWLNEHTPWALGRVADDSLLRVVYDPSIDKGAEGDIDVNALRVIRRRLPGRYQAGPVKWDPRRDALLRAINGMVGGQPMLQVDPTHAAGLVKALDGAWYYAQASDGQIKRADGKAESVGPKKPNHPHEDFGDAFCYLADGLRLATPERPANWTPRESTKAFSPYRYQQPKQRSRTTFNPYTVVR